MKHRCHSEKKYQHFFLSVFTCSVLNVTESFFTRRKSYSPASSPTDENGRCTPGRWGTWSSGDSLGIIVFTRVIFKILSMRTRLSYLTLSLVNTCQLVGGADLNHSFWPLDALDSKCIGFFSVFILRLTCAFLDMGLSYHSWTQLTLCVVLITLWRSTDNLEWSSNSDPIVVYF